MEPVAVGSVAEESLAGTFFFLPAGAALGAEAPDAAALVEDPALRVCAIVVDNNVWWTDDMTAEQEQNVEYHATYQLFCLHLQPNNGCSSSALSKSNLLLFAVTFCLFHGIVIISPSILHLPTVFTQRLLLASWPYETPECSSS